MATGLFAPHRAKTSGATSVLKPLRLREKGSGFGVVFFGMFAPPVRAIYHNWDKDKRFFRGRKL